MYGNGNIGATGTKSAIVPAGDGTYRKLYCMESPECWFEDFGSGLLAKGSARVRIDPGFAATVRTDQYYIFLVPEGDCKGLYVSAKGASGFSVRELQGGTSSLPFSYRVVALRKDVTAPPLEQISLPQMSEARPAGAPPAPPAPAVPHPGTMPSVPPMPPTLPVPPLPAVSPL